MSHQSVMSHLAWHCAPHLCHRVACQLLQQAQDIWATGWQWHGLCACAQAGSTQNALLWGVQRSDLQTEAAAIALICCVAMGARFHPQNHRSMLP